jgi:DCN1-like protein 4/5
MYRGLNSDQWRNFISFSFCIRIDFSNYDANDAWPSIYDEYVEWVRKKNVVIQPSDKDA